MSDIHSFQQMGKKLYFSSDADFGYGGKDLYVTNRGATGEWDSPMNLGPRVNTFDDEMFPFISKGGKLYFASNGHYGIGGLDLFKAEKRGRIFTNVSSLGYPINSGADDFSIQVVESDDDSVQITGYMASNRKGGLGSDDIYFFEKRLTPAPKLPPAVYILAGTIKEKHYVNPKDPKSEVRGLKPLGGVTINIFDNKSNNPYLLDEINSNELGKFEYQLDPDADFLLDYHKNCYFNLKSTVSSKNLNGEDGDTIYIETSAVLDRVFEELEFTINNIYYDLAKWQIRPDAALVLDSIVNFLNQNPTLKAELGSHTDARGGDDYNANLSQKRAESAVSYLIEKGISANRLSARGYGETRLVNECTDGVDCPEEKHQENRRTTFKIIGFSFESGCD